MTGATLELNGGGAAAVVGGMVVDGAVVDGAVVAAVEDEGVEVDGVVPVAAGASEAGADDRPPAAGRCAEDPQADPIKAANSATAAPR